MTEEAGAQAVSLLGNMVAFMSPSEDESQPVASDDVASAVKNAVNSVVEALATTQARASLSSARHPRHTSRAIPPAADKPGARPVTDAGLTAA